MLRQATIELGLGVLVLASVGSGLGASGQFLQANAKGSAELPPNSESTSQPAKKPNPAVTPANKPGKTEATETYAEEPYRIGIEDELQVSVWREPELSVSVVVRPDGKITMPLLNDIPVVGLRTDELQSLLTERLKSVVNEPQVTIIVRQIHSRKVYLFGEITRPGTYSLNGKKSVLELLAEGGGFTPFARRDSIYILRRTKDGKQIRVPFNYKKALNGRSENIELLPSDVVVVR